MNLPINLLGQRFGMLHVIKRVENDKWGKTQWLAYCDCGNEKVVIGVNLTLNRTKSCGCESIIKRNVDNNDARNNARNS
jgi:hypothetical protein